jgi:hypothetical protein
VSPALGSGRDSLTPRSCSSFRACGIQPPPPTLPAGCVTHCCASPRGQKRIAFRCSGVPSRMPVGCLHVPIPPGMLERWVKNRNRLLGSLVPSWGMPPKRCKTGIRTTSHSADSGISFELRSQSTVLLLAVVHGSVVHGHLLCTVHSTRVAGGELQGHESDGFTASVAHPCTDCVSERRGPQYQQSVHRGADAQRATRSPPALFPDSGMGTRGTGMVCSMEHAQS